MADHNGHREPATPEEIWNILREIAESQAESQKEADRRQKEADRRQKEADQRQKEADRRFQEADRRFQETRQLLQRQGQETDLRLRKLDDLFNGQWGKLMESLVEGDLVNLLNRRDIAVDHTISNPRKNYGERRWEFDVLAVNGDEVVVVEVKTTLKVADVGYFVERLHEFPELMPEYADHRVYGAVAYLKADGSVTVHAGRQGLFVIRATGSSASIINAEGFTPRTFGRRTPAVGGAAGR